MRDTQKLTDREVLQKAAEDQGYLSILVQRYRIPLYNFVFRFVGDRETAEDVVQETFLRCLRHSHQFPVIEQVSTWLYTIAGNLAKTELRRRKRWHWLPIGPSEEGEGRRVDRTSLVDQTSLVEKRFDGSARGALVARRGASSSTRGGVRVFHVAFRDGRVSSSPRRRGVVRGVQDGARKRRVDFENRDARANTRRDPRRVRARRDHRLHQRARARERETGGDATRGGASPPLAGKKYRGRCSH